ncbi:MAG: hypothetical protein MI742_14980 [Desulfobacterales bacterium]|nr:hypothetical protein [Desulfobacterales bacterium]
MPFSKKERLGHSQIERIRALHSQGNAKHGALFCKLFFESRFKEKKLPEKSRQQRPQWRMEHTGFLGSINVRHGVHRLRRCMGRGIAQGRASSIRAFLRHRGRRNIKENPHHLLQGIV